MQVSKLDVLTHHLRVSFQSDVFVEDLFGNASLQTCENVFFDKVSARSVKLIEELLDVFLIVELVTEDSATLMHPKSHHFLFVAMHKLLHHLDTSNDT